MQGRLYVGTSGFAYKQWKPDFYPPELKPAEMLPYYAERLPSVEINNTFYRMPTEATLGGWSTQTPEAFRFALKAPQRITHVKRLRTADDDSLEHFLRTARALGPRLGPILFGLPPTMKRDDARLEAFLAALPGEPFRFAFEFRHASWDDDEVRARLAASDVAWCAADTDESAADVRRTAAGWVYLRLRKSSYEDAELATWAERIRLVLAEGRDAYVYFKHEDEPSGVRYATRLRELLA